MMRRTQYEEIEDQTMQRKVRNNELSIVTSEVEKLTSGRFVEYKAVPLNGQGENLFGN